MRKPLAALSGLTVAAGVAVLAGVAVALLTPWSSPLETAFTWGNSRVDAVLDFGANSRLEPAASEADPAVDFPSALSELPNPPTHLAVDPVSGDLWFVVFSYSGPNELYHYTPANDAVAKQPIPASTGSELFSEIAIDSRGDVIFAEGGILLDIDPKGGVKELSLPDTQYYAKQQEWEGAFVTDMALSKDDKAYISRMNSAAIAEVDLATGSTNEIPLPAWLGQVYFVEVAGDALWMSTWADTATKPSQTAVLDLTTSVTELTPIKSSGLAADGEGSVYATIFGTPGLELARDKALAPQRVQVPVTALSGLRDFVDVDIARKTVWMAGEGARGVTSLDIVSGTTESYQLPSYSVTQPLSIPVICQQKPCPGLRRGSVTAVGDIAVTPAGDVFFSDKSFNRVGIIHTR